MTVDAGSRVDGSIERLGRWTAARTTRRSFLHRLGQLAVFVAAGPTIAGLLKNHGYMTGQFGKNHLGDRDEHLPTNHGFDEFLGNLYHLNAEELIEAVIGGEMSSSALR